MVGFTKAQVMIVSPRFMWGSCVEGLDPLLSGVFVSTCFLSRQVVLEEKKEQTR